MSQTHEHSTHGIELAKRGFRSKLNDEEVINLTKTIPSTFNEIRRTNIASEIESSTEAKVNDAVPIYNSGKSSAYRKRMKLIITVRKKRPRGRPRKRWLDIVEEDLKTVGVKEWKETIQNREK